MNLRFLLFVPGLSLVWLAAACSDTPSSARPTAAGSTATAPRATVATGATPDLGPAPVLGGYVLKVTPAHAAQVAQATTRSPDAGRPNGICFDANFENTPEYGQWFRMAVDGTEVTTKLTWILPTQNAPTKGTACYAPTNGLTVGRHEAAVSVQNPKVPTENPRQTIGWRFDVVP
jgi:hypothetical protein